ncbi:hypothetical protein V4100_001011 [Pseudomonas aeruginosa]
MTSHYHNMLFCQRSQTIKILDGLETGNHKFYNYKVACKKPGFRNFFDRMMIREFIEQQNITDVKESQFRYRLKKEHETLVEQGHPDEVLFSVGLVQRKKTTRDFVYLFSPLVLECVYNMIKDIATAKADKKAEIAAAAKERKKSAAAKKRKKIAAAKKRMKIASKAKSGPSGGGSKPKVRRNKRKTIRHKKTP